jgi:hypothetical protein
VSRVTLSLKLIGASVARCMDRAERGGT